MKPMYTLKEFSLKEFSNASENTDLVQKLIALGLYPGLQFSVVQNIRFSSVTIIQFDQTLVALNEREFACLIY